MSYAQWFDEHAKKHALIIEKLLKKSMTKEEIIAYFDFDSMVKNEPDFCPLYADNKKCHDMDNLNCYACACPNFRFSDAGIDKVDDKTLYSQCSIQSKDGKQYISEDAIHQDCSGCTVPHTVSYVNNHFDLEWKEMMDKCDEG